VRVRALVPRITIALWLALAPAALAAPRAVIDSGPPEHTSETTATITFHASAPGGLFPAFECTADGIHWGPCRSPVRLQGLTSGAHAFQVRLSGLFVDPAPARRSWIVDVPTVTEPPPLTPTSGPSPSHGLTVSGCANGAAHPSQVSSHALAVATLCLLNHQRHKHGLHKLRPNTHLARAAHGHALDMVHHDFFGHVGSDGRTLGQRVATTGFLSHARSWALGEVLVWTNKRLSTPQTAVRALMHSPPHRRLILDATYVQAGVAVVKHAPVRGVRRGATFVVDFARLTV
jgi:uncharacterized protein YkwD